MLMRIADIRVTRFHYASRVGRDAHGHGHPGPERQATQSLLTITTDDGATGHYFGAVDPDVIEHVVKPVLLGQHPLYRERLWHELKERQRLHLATLGDRVLTAVDLALWDLGGKRWASRSTSCWAPRATKSPPTPARWSATTSPGGLDTPEAYARYAIQCQERGYPAFKLHTWQPPLPGAPSVKRDLEACAAVREAVGPDYPLMLDPFHYYSRLEALELAKRPRAAGYLWMEEPMDEHSMSSYVWLCEQTSLPICGPETAEGKMYVRAEWIKAGACDMVRGGVGDVGGITGADQDPCTWPRRSACKLEVHGGGVGNLHVMCAMVQPRPLLRARPAPPVHRLRHAAPWLNTPSTRWTTQGYVHVSPMPRPRLRHQLGLHQSQHYAVAQTV